MTTVTPQAPARAPRTAGSGRGGARLLVLEMMTGAGLGAGVIMLGFCVVIAFTTTQTVPAVSWSNAFNLALMGLLYVAPLSAGITAHLVQDYRRRGIAALAATTRVGVVRGVGFRVAAVAAWGLIGYLTMLLAFILKLPRYGAPEGPTLLLGLLALMFLSTCVLLGWSLGTRISSRLIAPALTLGLFAVFYTLSYAPGWLRRLAPIDPETQYVSFLQPHVALVTAQVVLLAAVAVTAVAGICRYRTTSLTVAAIGVVAVSASVGWLARIDPSPTQLRTGGPAPVCRQTPVALCLRPENAWQLGPATVALSNGVRVLAPFLTVPTRFDEPGVGNGRDRGPGIYQPVYIDDPAVFASAAVAAILPACSTDTTDTAAMDAYADLYRWAQIRVGGDLLIPPERYYGLDRVIALDDGQQRAWVQRQLAAASCAG